MEEVSNGKMIRRYAIKLILWFILIDIIIGGALFIAKISGIDKIDNDDLEEAGKFIRSLLNTLLIFNVIAMIASPLLAHRSVAKKYAITDNNKGSFFKGVAISLVILAVLVIGIHTAIKNVIIMAIEDSSDISWEKTKELVKEAKGDKDLEEELEEEIQIIEILSGRLTFYSLNGLCFIVMIGCEYYLINIKSKQEA